MLVPPLAGHPWFGPFTVDANAHGTESRARREGRGIAAHGPRDFAFTVVDAGARLGWATTFAMLSPRG
jgi:hypothetical protein